MAAHWSDTITWRPGRWDPMANAPTDRRVRVRTQLGTVHEEVRFIKRKPAAWRTPDGTSVDAWEWQPTRALLEEPRQPNWPFPITDPARAAAIVAEQQRIRDRMRSEESA